MPNLISPKHHIWQAVPEVNNLCELLFQETNITYFGYARSYYEGFATGLFTNPEWFLHTLNHQIAPSNIEFKTKYEQYNLFGSSIIHNKLLPLEMKKYEKNVRAFNEIMGLDNMFVVRYLHPTYYEGFSFSASLINKNIFSFYFNNFNSIEKFIFTFREKASMLIKNANRQENRIFRLDHGLNNAVANESCSFNKSKQNINPQLLNVYPSVYNKIGSLCSSRELECLALMASGRTAKEIAKFMKISNRTVESHIYNLKVKLDCHYKSELIDIALENKLNFYLNKKYK